MDLKHICYSLISVSFLLPLVICAEDKAIRSIQSSDGQQEEPPGIYVGELTDSRHSRRNRKYKCYQGQMSERSNQELSECIGAFCMRIRHHQSGEEKLYCKNFTEPDDPKPGTCKEAPGHQMHGQTETICACEGNFCNGTYALNPLPLILLLACLAALLICSSFVGSVIFTR